MPKVFKHDNEIKVGDIVRGNADICKIDLGAGPVETFTGRVVNIRECSKVEKSYCDKLAGKKCRGILLSVDRKDGITGIGHDLTWLVGVQFCTKVRR